MKPGYPVQVPVVDIVEIGAGGGFDRADRCRPAPSASGRRARGPIPGPACYGRGGDKPTVTDAKLVTGVIDAERFAGGRMRLDRDAVDTVAHADRPAPRRDDRGGG